MPQENFPTFRGMLRGAICTRTQAQFANESGISAPHLNKLLNSEHISRPTKQTLHKIAAVAKNGITYEMLKKALDDEDPDFEPGKGSKEEQEERQQEAIQDFMPQFKERAKATMASLCRAIESHRYPYVTDDITGHIGQLLDTALEDNKIVNLSISYEIVGIWPYISGRHDYASKWMLVGLSMADNEETAETEMVIFYTELPGPGQKMYAAIQCVSTAPADISDVMGMPPAAIAAHRSDPEDFSCDCEAFDAAVNDPFYLEFDEVQRLHERFVDTKASSKEEALLHQIFGIKTEFSETTMGVGFWMDGLPPKFLEFVKEHKDVIFAPYHSEPENLESLGSALDEAIQKDSPAIFTDVLAQLEYVGTGDNDLGPGACIAEALVAATGFPFIYRKHTDPDDNEQGFPNLSDKDCIILPEADMEKDGIHREPALLALGNCIQELDLKTFGDILFTRMEITFRKPKTYRLRRHDETGEPNDAAPEHKPEYIVDFSSGIMPESSGRYAVKLKDGRELMLMYLKKQGIWLFRNKEWSNLIEAYDPEPVWLPSSEPAAYEDENDGEGQER